jgi:predicted ATPase
MEICYYWLEEYIDTIKQQGYNFGSELIFNFDPFRMNLVIKENKFYVNGFFNVDKNNQITNVTAIVGKNGVGKSTFLRALRGLIYEGGILGKRIEDKLEYRFKRILVIKNQGVYKIIYHQDLLPFGKDSIRYEESQLEEKFKFEFISYGISEENMHKFGHSDLHRVNGTEGLENTSCIFLSYSFNIDFYQDSTVEKKKYFDISTKGILTNIDTQMKLDPNFSVKNPNQLTNRDKRFNIGILNEYYISEIKERINLLSDVRSKEIIEKHGFFPKRIYLNLDYIFHKRNNFKFINIDKSELLRFEKDRTTYNKIERLILEKLDLMPVDRNTLTLARQTYLIRILDAYFDDVERFIAVPERYQHLKDIINNIDDSELEGKNILELLEFFNKLTIENLRDASTPRLKEFDLKFNEFQFRELTKSYLNFIKYFNESVITQDSLFHLEKGNVNFARTKSDKEMSIIEKDIAIIGVPLNSEGLGFLKQFIEQYEKINTGTNFIKVQWDGLSSGEDTLLGIYSRFFSISNEDLGENAIILLDEIEHSLHPEWQRRLINNLLEYLPYVYSRCKSIQIVLATNVPFLIADIPTQNVIYLERKHSDELEEKVTTNLEIFTQTFAANIHSLLMNNFFMDSTIGQFSEKKIGDIIKILNSAPKEETTYSQEEIQRMIQIIGEPIIRNKLQDMYYRKFNKSKSEEKVSALIENFREAGDYSVEKVNSLLSEIQHNSKN